MKIKYKIKKKEPPNFIHKNMKYYVGDRINTSPYGDATIITFLGCENFPPGPTKGVIIKRDDGIISNNKSVRSLGGYWIPHEYIVGKISH